MTSLLPAQLVPYSAEIALVLVFVDGVIFGVWVKMNLLSAILFVSAVLLAAMVGLILPVSGSTPVPWTQLNDTINSQIEAVGQGIAALPISWIIGFAAGYWRG
jgi:hypothetical protein